MFDLRDLCVLCGSFMTSARHRRLRSVIAFAVLIGASGSTTGAAQDAHLHTPAVSGMPQGVPLLCANPTVTSVRTGAWSNPDTWSTKKAPAASDRVPIDAAHTVAYDAVSDATIQCIEVRGRLAFKTDASTRLKVLTIMVLANGSLEIGSPAEPVAQAVTAEVVIADQPIDKTVDPSEV